MNKENWKRIGGSTGRCTVGWQFNSESHQRGCTGSQPATNGFAPITALLSIQ